MLLKVRIRKTKFEIMSRPFQYSIIGFIGVITLMLLVGTRLQLTIAGGAGYAPNLRATVMDASGVVTELRRGAIVSTGRGEHTLLEIDGTRIGLYEDTEIELTTLTKEQIELTVKKGRLAIDTLRAPDRAVTAQTQVVSATTIGGQMSFVYYDWQQRVSVIPLTGLVSAIINDQIGQISSAPFDVSEVAPYAVTDTTFVVEGSAAEAFYLWFQSVNAS